MKTKRGPQIIVGRKVTISQSQRPIWTKQGLGMKREREGQDRVVRGKGPPRRDSRRGGARLYSLIPPTRAGIPGEYKGWGNTSVWKSAHPARLGGAFPFGGERGNGKECGALSRSIRLSGCCSFPFPLPPHRSNSPWPNHLNQDIFPLSRWNMFITMNARRLMHSSLTPQSFNAS